MARAPQRMATIEDYARGVLAGDRATLGRAITLIESGKEEHAGPAQQLLQRLLPHTGKAHRIGITGVPGVGKKTAEKIVFHLKDKFGAAFPLGPGAPFSDLDTEIVGALTALGYSIVEAQSALASLPRDETLDVEERIRRALAYFAKS